MVILCVDPWSFRYPIPVLGHGKKREKGYEPLSQNQTDDPQHEAQGSKGQVSGLAVNIPLQRLQPCEQVVR